MDRYSDRGDRRDDRDDEDRGFFDRAADEVRSWFGDEDADRRRRVESHPGDHFGDADDRRARGPRNPNYYDDQNFNQSGFGARDFEELQAGRDDGTARGGRRPLGDDTRGAGRAPYEARGDYGRGDFGAQNRPGGRDERRPDYGRSGGAGRDDARGGRGYWDDQNFSQSGFGARDFEALEGGRRRDDDRPERGRPWGQGPGGRRGGEDFGRRTPSGGSDYRMAPGRETGAMGAGPYSGHGPEEFVRNYDRIKSQVNERLTHHGHVDARQIRVTVADGEVTLEGTVRDRRMKRLAEQVAESVSGVHDVHNRLRVERPEGQDAGRGGDPSRERDAMDLSGTSNPMTAGTTGAGTAAMSGSGGPTGSASGGSTSGDGGAGRSAGVPTSTGAATGAPGVMGGGGQADGPSASGEGPMRGAASPMADAGSVGASAVGSGSASDAGKPDARGSKS